MRTVRVLRWTPFYNFARNTKLSYFLRSWTWNGITKDHGN
uniref:Bm13136 n=1 Tax=Brugia malayi TaxID=6279 RepID=A0A1I9G3K6_BRUMA|nr:Bm13136 [Brugia malayi]